MNIREMTKADLPEVISLRTRTRENALSLEALAALGITEESVSAMLHTSHRGWVCLDAGQIVGFAMGNRDTGEMWVIAVLSEYEQQGIGKELLYYVQNWLWEKGWDEIWLTTDIDTTLRAYGFYKKMGWEDSEIRNGMRYMKLSNPNPPGRHLSFLRAAKKLFN